MGREDDRVFGGRGGGLGGWEGLKKSGVCGTGGFTLKVLPRKLFSSKTSTFIFFNYLSSKKYFHFKETCINLNYTFLPSYILS